MRRLVSDLRMSGRTLTPEELTEMCALCDCDKEAGQYLAACSVRDAYGASSGTRYSPHAMDVATAREAASSAYSKLINAAGDDSKIQEAVRKTIHSRPPGYSAEWLRTTFRKHLGTVVVVPINEKWKARLVGIMISDKDYKGDPSKSLLANVALKYAMRVGVIR